MIMNHNSFILLFATVIVVVLSNVNAKQISEIKCEEITTLITSPQSKYPHLIEVVMTDNHGGYTSICTGTLISAYYVLTSGKCTGYGKENFRQLRVRKLKLPGESFSNDKVYTIYRYVTHHLYDESTLHIYNDIGLLHLNESIPYHIDGSVFRPACLWTNNLLRAAYKYTVYGKNPNDDIKTVSLITNNECNIAYMGLENPFSDGIVDFHMCMNTSDTNFVVNKGSPIQAIVGNRLYIFGIVSDTYPNSKLIVGTKVSRFVRWIEPIVWARHKNEISPSGCGERKIKHKPLITYGLPTYHGEFPWHVALFRRESDQTVEKYICGGTIVNTRTILTAAHCVQNETGVLSAHRLKIVAGKFRLNVFSADARNYSVETITVHEEYNRDYLENDIALLKLRATIEFSNYIQPICITDNSDLYSIPMGIVAGWGRDEHNQQSDILMKGTLPIRINSECRDSNRDFFPNYLNDNNYCAGFENGTNVCSGDSGGAMIFEHSSRYYIRGIVSLGVALPNSDRCNVMQMILLTDVPKFYEWIVNYLEQN